MNEPRTLFQYLIFGWTLLSELEFSGLEVNPAPETPPDLFLHFGVVPESLPNSTRETLVGEVLAGQCLLKIRNAGRFLVSNGREVTIEPDSGACLDSLRLFFLGPVLGILLHQRSYYPVHASAILNNGSAVMFAGPSGSGKSTLAAAFLRRGHDVIADDICALEVVSAPEILRGPPYLLLWEDCLTMLGPFASPPRQVRDGLQKFAIPVQASGTDRFPVRNCYILDTEQSRNIELEPAEGIRKIEMLAQQTYRRTILEPMNLVQSNFEHICRTAAAIRVVVVRRPRGEFNAGRIAELIAEDLNV